MEIVATHGNGTYDHDKKQWKIRTKEITKSMTIRELSKLFGVDIPADEGLSRPYWRKFLKAYRNYLAKKEGRFSPLQERIASLEGFVADFRVQGRDTKQLEAELAEARKVPADDIDHSDAPAIHPDMREHAEVLDAVGELTDFTSRFLNSIAPKPIPKAESLKAEVEAYMERGKARAKPGSKGYMSLRPYLRLFLEKCGDIRTADITVQHYRAYWQAVITNPKWNKVSQGNAIEAINTFLKRMETDHGFLFGFRHSSEYKIGKTEGQKKQYTLEEVRKALQHATGINRNSLLLALNTGAYWGDISTLKREEVKDGYLTGPREKNSAKTVQVIGTWYLWPETREALAYGYTNWQLESNFKKFRDEHGLPEHKALRKTVTQLIHEDIGDTESRLYDYRAVPGVHGTNYIKNFTPAQIADLEVALKYVREVLFLNAPRRDKKGNIREKPVATDMANGTVLG